MRGEPERGALGVENDVKSMIAANRHHPPSPRLTPRNKSPHASCITINSYIYALTMNQRHSPLADQFAGLRAATTSKDDRGWLPTALHTLIAAILARIFGRLEQLILLWQTDALPAPRTTPDQVSTGEPDRVAARTPPPAARPAANRARQHPRAIPAPIDPTVARAAPLRHPPGGTPSNTAKPSAPRPRRPRCRTRAPPPPRKPGFARRPSLVNFITVSK